MSPRSTLLGLLILASQAACLASGPQNGAGQTNGGLHHPGCELTMQSNTFAGLCGELILLNSGSLTMHGWTVDFDLPPSGRLVNAWNAEFTAQNSHITVQPTQAEMVLAPGQTVSLGYCSSGAASNVDLTAGLCSDLDANDVVTTSTTVSGGFSDAFVTLDANRWTVQDGNGTDLPCRYSNSAVQASSNAVGLTVSSGADGTPVCSELTSVQSYTYGQFSARLQAPSASGLVTGFALRGRDDAGTEGLAITLGGDANQMAYLTLWHDGVASTTAVALDFASGSALHTYGFSWETASIVWTVDGAVVATTTNDLPAAVPMQIAINAYSGSPETGFASSVPSAGEAVLGEVDYTPWTPADL